MGFGVGGPAVANFTTTDLATTIGVTARVVQNISGSEVISQIYNPLAIFSSVDNYGGVYAGDPFSYEKQLFSSPATDVTAVGDPVGLLIPENSNRSTIINWLLNSDNATGSSWLTTSTTVTGNYALNDAGVPLAALVNVTAANGGIRQTSITIPAGNTDIWCYYAEVYAGTAAVTQLTLEISTGGTTNTATAVLTWSGLSVAASGSANNVTAGIEAGATAGWYKLYVSGSNSGGANTNIRVLFYGAGTSGGTGTVIVGRQGLVKGTVPGTHQANGACLGGSAERTGGANLFTWSEDFANPGWNKDSCSVSDSNLITLTAAAAAHRVYQASPIINGLQYTFWFDVTYTNHQYWQLHMRGSSTPGRVNFDLVGGTLNATTATGTMTEISPGRWVISMTMTGSAASVSPALGAVTGLSASAGESWTAAGTETLQLNRAWLSLGASTGTYSRNLGGIGGKLKYAVPYTDVTGDRLTASRRPLNGIRNQFTTTTDTFSTRTFTTQAVQYTLSFKGTGTVTLSGTSTAGPLIGTGANDRVSLTFTPTAGTLTLTLTGSATEAQIEFGATATAYQSVAAAWDITEAGQPYVYGWWGDGTSDRLTTNVQSYGSCSLQAIASQQWTVLAFGLRTSKATAMAVAKAASTNANINTFLLRSNTGTQVSVSIRGSGTNFSKNFSDLEFHNVAVRWDGSLAKGICDDGALETLNVGTAAEEAGVITLFCKRTSAVDFWLGHIEFALLIDRALSDAEMTAVMAWANRTYRYGL